MLGIETGTSGMPGFNVSSHLCSLKTPAGQLATKDESINAMSRDVGLVKPSATDKGCLEQCLITVNALNSTSRRTGSKGEEKVFCNSPCAFICEV